MALEGTGSDETTDGTDLVAMLLAKLAEQNEQLAARDAALAERDAQIAAREASLMARVSSG